MRRVPWHRSIAFAQGTYYAVTGLWALVSLQTFLRVTGPKTDTWLVQTVGVLVLAIAFPLLLGALRDRIGAELRLLGFATALGFLLVDVTFYAQGRIGGIYLADALMELAIAAAWLVPSSWIPHRERRGETTA